MSDDFVNVWNIDIGGTDSHNGGESFERAMDSWPGEVDDHREVQQRAPKLRKLAVEEEVLSGEAWEEMARKAKLVLDAEGDPVGALGRVADEWEKLGCSATVLEWMRVGIPMLLKEQPRSRGGRRNYVKKSAMEFANEEISRLLFLTAVETDKFTEDEGYVFPLGAVPKPHKEDAFRLVTDITDQGRGTERVHGQDEFQVGTCRRNSTKKVSDHLYP